METKKIKIVRFGIAPNKMADRQKTKWNELIRLMVNEYFAKGIKLWTKLVMSVEKRVISIG